MAKDYFKDKGLEFEDIDVSNDKFAAQEMVEKSGQMGVPVIDIEGEIVIGYDVPKLDEILSRKKIDEVDDSAEITESKDDNFYDALIIGGSSAGLTAALFAARREMNVLVVTKDIGGQVSNTLSIENYPGIMEIDGPELVNRFKEQVIKYGVEIKKEEIVEVDVIPNEKSKDTFRVVTSDGDEFLCKSLIVATGRTPRSLNVPGEKKFLGKGVSYCANCDAPLFRDKKVAVVGGGNSAFDAALLLSKIADKVYLIHRREKFRAFESLVKELENRGNVEFVLNSEVSEIVGDEFVTAINVKENIHGTIKKIEVDGVFIEIGSEVDTGFINDVVDTDDLNQIIIDKHMGTSHDGIFAAGDVTDTPFKQIAAASGDGCKAALASYNYLHDIENKYIKDWTAHKKEDK